MMMSVIWIFWSLFIIFSSHGAAEDTIRPITQGRLRGTMMTSRLGRPFYAYRKIPYAQPPLGNLRFTDPVEHDGWTGIFDATEDGPICPQKNIFKKDAFYFKGEEDCLYLNVYTPLSNESLNKKLPVMVWLHGGGWVTGNSRSDLYAPNFLLDKDIVFVSVNYRVGPMGFLSMEDEVLPGNWGLKDQVLALRWVRDNIHYFGGDPNLVTIFGESAGGSSIHHHMVSPMSQGLFHRAISQSGTSYTSWSLSMPGATRNNTIKIAELLKCPTEPTSQLVECMRRKHIEEIIGQDIPFMEWFFDPMTPFKPVVERLAEAGKAFLPEHPEVALSNGKLANVPWMTGVTSGEGALRVAGIFYRDGLIQELDRDFSKIGPITFFYKGKTDDIEKTSRMLRKFYFGDRPIGEETIKETVDLYTDSWFFAGTEQALRLHRQYSSSPAYYYHFSYRGSASFTALFGDASRDYGVSHADDLIYLFPSDALFSENPMSSKDRSYIDIMLQLWTDFAKYGNPTPDHSPLGFKWLPVQSDKLEYLHIAAEGVEMKDSLWPERSAFWSNLNLSGRERLHDEL